MVPIQRAGKIAPPGSPTPLLSPNSLGSTSGSPNPLRSPVTRSCLDKSLPPKPKHEEEFGEKRERSSKHIEPTTIVLVGPKQQPFRVNKRRLCEVSPFFRDRLQDSSQDKPVSLWLPRESTTMFALFAEWVHSPHSFRSFLDCALSAAHDANPLTFQDLHWAIIRLHLFAAHLLLYQLQDLSMDAIQDLYLRCDWDVPAALIIYLYSKCEALPAVRIRRWAVAMVGFSMTVSSQLQLRFHPEDSSTSDLTSFRDLLACLPEFATDYGMHVRNMRASGLDIRFKNPQLRIAANKLRNDQRLFGFRECSFHSHRAAVGEGRCPHASLGRTLHRDSRSSSRRGSGHSESEVGEKEVVFGLSIMRNEEVDPRPEPLFSQTIEEEEEAVHFHSQLSPVR